MVDFAQGRYQVENECSGFRTQRCKMTVQGDGETLSDVALRAH